ncbi:MAG TPA: hypothetical protein ENN21_02545 [Spirochaetes bacterium]|nr:hypothetical protein [Spirochaetota bacterium]
MKFVSGMMLRHHDKEINSLAKQAIIHNYSSRRIMREVEKTFKPSNHYQKQHLASAIMHCCYDEILSGGAAPAGKNYAVMAFPFDDSDSSCFPQDCFALKLCDFLANQLEVMSPAVGENSCLPREFYEQCVAMLTESDLRDEISDAEILLIHLKQSAIIMKRAGLIHVREGRAVVNRQACSSPSLYARLLTAFWDKTKWESIFPSNPSAARELKKSRNILLDLCAARPGIFSVSELANDFFEMTGYGKKNDLFLISFLDFYLFTWLGHFGIINYPKFTGGAQVRIAITEAGSKVISFLQNR